MARNSSCVSFGSTPFSKGGGSDRKTTGRAGFHWTTGETVLALPPSRRRTHSSIEPPRLARRLAHRSSPHPVAQQPDDAEDHGAHHDGSNQAADAALPCALCLGSRSLLRRAVRIDALPRHLLSQQSEVGLRPAGE